MFVVQTLVNYLRLAMSLCLRLRKEGPRFVMLAPACTLTATHVCGVLMCLELQACS